MLLQIALDKQPFEAARVRRIGGHLGQIDKDISVGDKVTLVHIGDDIGSIVLNDGRLVSIRVSELLGAFSLIEELSTREQLAIVLSRSGEEIIDGKRLRYIFAKTMLRRTDLPISPLCVRPLPTDQDLTVVGFRPGWVICKTEDSRVVCFQSRYLTDAYFTIIKA
jgi:hypothetical protein